MLPCVLVATALELASVGHGSYSLIKALLLPFNSTIAASPRSQHQDVSPIHSSSAPILIICLFSTPDLPSDCFAPDGRTMPGKLQFLYSGSGQHKQVLIYVQHREKFQDKSGKLCFFLRMTARCLNNNVYYVCCRFGI